MKIPGRHHCWGLQPGESGGRDGSSPVESRGEAAVEGLGDELKQFADIVYRF